jgi:hypothetical protein
MDQQTSGEDYRQVAAGRWQSDVYQGYFIDELRYDYIYEIYSAATNVIIPDGTGNMIAGLFGRAGTQSVTDAERGTLSQVMATFRIGNQ